MATVTLQAGSSVELQAPRGRNVFLYVVSGRIGIAGASVDRWHLVTLADDGDAVAIAADQDTVLLFGHADPIGEPVVAHGPFVMNSREEIETAIRDYHAGAFNRPAS
jgi:redox-sensitive bicupin YhaK (pirin superfamily)